MQTSLDLLLQQLQRPFSSLPLNSAVPICTIQPCVGSAIVEHPSRMKNTGTSWPLPSLSLSFLLQKPEGTKEADTEK